MKLHIEKFKSIENLTIEIPVQIKGANKLGKTTILEAVAFCLTGKDLNGKTFEEVYDTRVDLHDAVADVTFTDSYGNTWRRVVNPVFEISRQGVERIKVLRSTQCYKNDIAVNDYAVDFRQFEIFGTDAFFKLKENEQREIFIDLAKSKLPNFDLKTKSLKLVQKEKSQRQLKKDIEQLRAELKGITDVEIPEISEHLQNLENEYRNKILALSENEKLTNEILQKNAESQKVFYAEKEKKESVKNEANKTLMAIEHNIIDAKNDLEKTLSSTPELKSIIELSEQEGKVKELEKQLDALPFFHTIEDFFEKEGKSNIQVKENIAKIKELNDATVDNLPEWVEVTDVCPTCETKSDKFFSKQINFEIEKLKKENKKTLTVAMDKKNESFLSVQKNLEFETVLLDKIKFRNSEIEKENNKKSTNFETEKQKDIKHLSSLINELEATRKVTKKTLDNAISEIEAMKMPELETLPTDVEISEELKDAHTEYLNAKEIQTKQIGVNENNVLERQLRDGKIKSMQTILFNLDTEIVKLKQEISNYFSHLDKVVDETFTGRFEIGVKLQELIVTKNEYKDVFKITADGRVFPYECSGAMINNIKLQILRGLQNLADYKGITIMDNVEANTTEKIEAYDLSLISAQATFDKELTFEKL